MTTPANMTISKKHRKRNEENEGTKGSKMNLVDYVVEHTIRGECECGRCSDKGNSPTPEGHTADVVMFVVATQNNPDAVVLRDLIENNPPAFNDINLFDGESHNYIEIGAWIGDQGLALMLMGLGKILGLWELITPKTLFGEGFLTDEQIMQFAAGGFIHIEAKKP